MSTRVFLTPAERARKAIADQLWAKYLEDIAKGIPARESPARKDYNQFIFGVPVGLGDFEP